MSALENYVLIFQQDVHLEVVDEPEIQLEVVDEPEIQFIVSEQIGGLEQYDYNDLKNLPTLDGEIFQGDMHEKDPTVPDWAKKQTRPVYTASDVGAVSKDEVEILSEETLNNIWNSL